jgi:hypothetical protein
MQRDAMVITPGSIEVLEIARRNQQRATELVYLQRMLVARLERNGDHDLLTEAKQRLDDLRMLLGAARKRLRMEVEASG